MRRQPARALALTLVAATAVACIVAIAVILKVSQHPRNTAASIRNILPTPKPILTVYPLPTLPTHNLPTIALVRPPGIPTWQPGAPDTESGMHFSVPGPSYWPPAVSNRQAITIAETVDYAPSTAPWVTARYVLMSQEDPRGWENDLVIAHLAKQHPDGWKDIPVWIVSFEGLKFHTSNGFSLTPLPARREFNVIVSAENGEVLGGYTFR